MHAMHDFWDESELTLTKPHTAATATSAVSASPAWEGMASALSLAHSAVLRIRMKERAGVACKVSTVQGLQRRPMQGLPCRPMYSPIKLQLV